MTASSAVSSRGDRDRVGLRATVFSPHHHRDGVGAHRQVHLVAVVSPCQVSSSPTTRSSTWILAPVVRRHAFVTVNVLGDLDVGPARWPVYEVIVVKGRAQPVDQRQPSGTQRSASRRQTRRGDRDRVGLVCVVPSAATPSTVMVLSEPDWSPEWPVHARSDVSGVMTATLSARPASVTVTRGVLGVGRSPRWPCTPSCRERRAQRGPRHAHSASDRQRASEAAMRVTFTV